MRAVQRACSEDEGAVAGKSLCRIFSNKEVWDLEKEFFAAVLIFELRKRDLI